MSLPLGLITPSVAASVSTIGSRVTANTAPAPSINSAPMMSMRLRPMRSALVVSHSEITASPASVNENSTPICVALSPSRDRYSASDTDKKP